MMAQKTASLHSATLSNILVNINTSEVEKTVPSYCVNMTDHAFILEANSEVLF